MEELVATGKATPAEVAAMLDVRRIRTFPNTSPTGAEANTSFSAWARKS
jgi:hypothetical protein